MQVDRAVRIALHFAPMKRLKTYIYISDAKLDQYYPQIAKPQKKVKESLGFDFKLLKGSHDTEVEPQVNRISKLNAVVAYIRDNENVGTVDEPGEFLEGTMLMRWGGWSFSSELVYFGGSTQTTEVGLAGSAIHIVGGNTPRKEVTYLSTLPFLLRAYEESRRT